MSWSPIDGAIKRRTLLDVLGAAGTLYEREHDTGLEAAA